MEPPRTDVGLVDVTVLGEGVGITCDSLPAGYVQDGFAPESLHVPGGVYAYWVPGA